MKFRKTDGNQGFTILEVAIVAIVGGIILASFSTGLLAYIKKTQLETTTMRLEAINKAVQQFVTVNGRLPCPAPRDPGIDTVNYGVSIRTSANGCQDGGAAGTDRAANVRTYAATGDSLDVRIGAVPTRTLNLPDEFMSDAWGSRFTYAMTEQLSEVPTFFQDSGAITVVDSNGLNVVLPAGTGQYIILSHGPDRMGSVDATSGFEVAACPGGTTLDGNNCDDNETFTKTLATSNAGGVGQFDDLVYIGTQTNQKELLPAGMVMAFSEDRTNCPDGWTLYTDANQKTIVGATGSGEYVIGAKTFGHDSITLNASQIPSHQHALGSTQILNYVAGTRSAAYIDATMIGGAQQTGDNSGGGSPIDIRNRYIALIYCRKD